MELMFLLSGLVLPAFSATAAPVPDWLKGCETLLDRADAFKSERAVLAIYKCETEMSQLLKSTANANAALKKVIEKLEPKIPIFLETATQFADAKRALEECNYIQHISSEHLNSQLTEIEGCIEIMDISVKTLQGNDKTKSDGLIKELQDLIGICKTKLQESPDHIDDKNFEIVRRVHSRVGAIRPVTSLWDRMVDVVARARSLKPVNKKVDIEDVKQQIDENTAVLEEFVFFRESSRQADVRTAFAEAAHDLRARLQLALAATRDLKGSQFSGWYERQVIQKQVTALIHARDSVMGIHQSATSLAARKGNRAPKFPGFVKFLNFVTAKNWFPSSRVTHYNAPNWYRWLFAYFQRLSDSELVQIATEEQAFNKQVLAEFEKTREPPTKNIPIAKSGTHEKRRRLAIECKNAVDLANDISGVLFERLSRHMPNQTGTHQFIVDSAGNNDLLADMSKKMTTIAVSLKVQVTELRRVVAEEKMTKSSGNNPNSNLRRLDMALLTHPKKRNNSSAVEEFIEQNEAMVLDADAMISSEQSADPTVLAAVKAQLLADLTDRKNQLLRVLSNPSPVSPFASDASKEEHAKKIKELKKARKDLGLPDNRPTNGNGNDRVNFDTYRRLDGHLVAVTALISKLK